MGRNHAVLLGDLTILAKLHWYISIEPSRRVNSRRNRSTSPSVSPVELTIDRADLPNPGIDRLSPDGSVLGDRQFWIELGKLGEKPLRKRRLEKIGDHDVTERFSAEECPGSCPRGRVFRRTLLPNEPFWTASNFSSFVKTPERALHLTGRWISATGHPDLAW